MFHRLALIDRTVISHHRTGVKLARSLTLRWLRGFHIYDVHRILGYLTPSPSFYPQNINCLSANFGCFSKIGISMSPPFCSDLTYGSPLRPRCCGALCGSGELKAQLILVCVSTVHLLRCYLSPQQSRQRQRYVYPPSAARPRARQCVSSYMYSHTVSHQSRAFSGDHFGVVVASMPAIGWPIWSMTTFC